MTEEQILELLKNRLSIRLDNHYESFSGSGIRVSLELDGNEISSDYLMIDND